MSTLAAWATVDPRTLSGKAPHQVDNFVDGAWAGTNDYVQLPDPLNGDAFIRVADTSLAEGEPFIRSLQSCPKSGLHNPFKNPERYTAYGLLSAEVASVMRDPKVEEFFSLLVQRVAPKSYAQAKGEVVVTRRFLENFSGDQVRFLAQSFGVSGDHLGQETKGYRWPYGPTAIVAPFNFPIEIPVLQLMGALFMGNKVLFKGDSRVSVVMEQFIRLLLHCGLPPKDLDFINTDGPVMGSILEAAKPRMTQFTGSSRVAEILCDKLHGKVKIEDAGFDWKILGPDASQELFEYVAVQSDTDAYAYSGQKCSAQSILFMHANWDAMGLVNRLEELAKRRKLTDLTVGPILTVTTERAMKHVEALLALPGAKLLFGGKPLQDSGAETIPKVYGAWHPTAVFVPLEEMLRSEETFALCTTEIFGPLQVITKWEDSQLALVIEACERMDHHLTAALVTNDLKTKLQVLGNTVNGTTYCGMRARTTGAPQNHFFGPGGDPRGAGIGTREAIQNVWSHHREIVFDEGPTPKDWTTPAAT